MSAVWSLQGVNRTSSEWPVSVAFDPERSCCSAATAQNNRAYPSQATGGLIDGKPNRMFDPSNIFPVSAASCVGNGISGPSAVSSSETAEYAYAIPPYGLNDFD
jgi:hypothetical protein